MAQEWNNNNSQISDKNSYLQELTTYLTGLPSEERQAALTYYEEYFDDVGADGFAKVIAELGPPKRLAVQILSEYDRGYLDFEPQGSSASLPAKPEEVAGPEGQEQAAADPESAAEQQAKAKDQQKTAADANTERSNNRLLVIILIIVALPLLLPLAGATLGLMLAAMGIIIGLFAGSLALTIGLSAAGLGLLTASLPLMTVTLWDGLLVLGTGLLLLALGLLTLLVLLGVCFKLLPAIVNGTFSLFGRLLKRR